MNNWQSTQNNKKPNPNSLSRLTSTPSHTKQLQNSSKQPQASTSTTPCSTLGAFLLHTYLLPNPLPLPHNCWMMRNREDVPPMGNRESECLWLRHVHVPIAGSPCWSWCMCMMQFQAPPSPLKGGMFNHTKARNVPADFPLYSPLTPRSTAGRCPICHMTGPAPRCMYCNSSGSS